MNKEVSAALVTGPAYDPLYERLQGFAEETGVRVSVGFGGDHPALNRHLASLDEVPYDLVSTHTKYAICSSAQASSPPGCVAQCAP